MDNIEIRQNVIHSAFSLARAMKRGPHRMEHDLPPAVERTLMTIAKNDGLSAGELCEALDIRPSSVSELTEKMAERGLVEKRADETDKRVSRIFLTELGTAQAERIEKNREGSIAEFSGCFTDEEAEQFAALAGKLAEHLKSLAGDDAEGCCGGGMHHGHGMGHHGGPGFGHGPHRGPHGGHCRWMHHHPMHRF